MTTDTATIDCPVKCEGCDVVVPMAGALHTEDPVYLCGKCAAGAVESQMRAERNAEKDRADAAERMVAELGTIIKEQRDIALEGLATAERARDEVGIQLAAAQAEIARMRPVVEAARRTVRKIGPEALRFHRLNDIPDALRALDAVPGDALAREAERTTRFEVNVLNTDIAKVIADALVEAYGQLVEVDLVEGGCSLSGSEVAHVEAATRVLGDAVERVRAAGHVEDDKAPTELFPEGGRR